MKSYLQKFNEQYKGKKSIDIEFFNEEPLTMKYARYNQSGEVCYCKVDSKQAKQKTKDGWQTIQCDTFKCEHRQKNEFGKCACNRIGWLKFIIPSVCKDRIFLMRITGQTSLNRLHEYFYLQKSQGNSIKGKYTIFLKQEEQTNSLGKIFNNYVLDILKKEDKEDFISQDTISKITQNQLSTNVNKNVNNKVENKKVIPIGIKKDNVENTATDEMTIDNIQKETTNKKSTKDTSKKETKSKTKKVSTKETEQSKTVENKVETSEKEDSLKNCYALLSTFKETIANKEYIIGEFADMKDQISNIVIRPEDAAELTECDLGTFVKLEITEIKGRKFAMKLEYIEKTLKKVAV